MKLNWSTAGEGKVVVLLHGLFGRMQNFGGLAKRLSRTHRVIALDLRNHGASPHAVGMSYDAMADDVLETLGGLGALPCALLGHSMGGKVAMVTALRAPEAVARLVVADIAPIAYQHGNARVAAALRAVRLHPGLQRRDADLAIAEAVPDAAIRSFLLQNLAFGAAPEWKIGLSEIAAGLSDVEGWPEEAGGVYGGPALFIRGERSEYVGNSAWPVIEALFPRARLVTVSDAGHWLHADQPELFGAAVEAFLAS